MLLTVEMLIALSIFIIAFTIFILVVKTIFWDKHQQFDSWVFQGIKGFVNETNTRIMLFFSVLGNFRVLLFSNISLITYFLFIKKHKWYSIKIPAVALGSVALMLILKEFFNRQRPLIPLLEPAFGLSFPSGHAMSSVTFYGLLIYLLVKNKINIYLQIAGTLILLLMIFFIGISRIYLKVHFPTDVIGGYCAGLIWLMLSLWILNKIEALNTTNLEKVI